MDEPTAAISVQKVGDVLALIGRLRDAGKTVLLVSHRLEDLLQVCDRIVVFRQGKVRTILENRDLSIADSGARHVLARLRPSRGKPRACRGLSLRCKASAASYQYSRMPCVIFID